jgi:hypothetical protein
MTDTQVLRTFRGAASFSGVSMAAMVTPKSVKLQKPARAHHRSDPYDVEQSFGFVEDWPEWRRHDFEEFQRTAALGAKLWGNSEHLRHQLLLPSPEIRPGHNQGPIDFGVAARERLSANQKWMPKPAIPVNQW